MWTYQHNKFNVYQLPVLHDNYIYIIEDCHSDSVIIIDPALALPTQEACQKLHLTPTHILNTHHHWDHTDGNQKLVDTYQCEVIANHADASRIPLISQPIHPAQPLMIGNLTIQVLDVPGHTVGHIAFVIDDALFCGDTLFGAGCGRLFEGSFEQMWTSLQQLAKLDNNTKVYCAHEYTLANLDFASEIEPTNKTLQKRIQKDTQTRHLQQPTIPSRLGLEKETNPFLRPLDANFCLQYNQQTKQEFNACQIFQDIRTRKNNWS